MKRTLFLLAVLFTAALSIHAVPAKRGVWRTITLADGTSVKVEQVGDEHFHCLQAADGTRYRYDSNTGTYCVFTATEQQQAQTSARARRMRSQAYTAPRLAADKSIFRGTKHALVILAEFIDSKFADDHNVDLYKQIVNEKNYTENGFKGSVRDYFYAQSGGVFDLDFDVVGICPLAHELAYYGRDNEIRGRDINPGAMIVEACQWAYNKKGVDFSQYDWDNDGYVEEVFVLYAGMGQADGGEDDTIWPHKYELRNTSYGNVLTLGNVNVDVYACSCELNGEGSLCGIGTFCHEFSHCMGFPDLYDTSDGPNFGMANFDLMGSGNYNEGGYVPCGYSAYEKNECGWITLHDITNIEQDLDVNGMKAVSDGGDAYILKNKGHEDEYYIVENRQKTHWDASLPASGIMITHVDYDDRIWFYDVPNATNGAYYNANKELCYNDHQRFTIFHADNTDSFYDKETDLYPYGENDSLTATSTPAAALYNTNSDGTKFMHIDIKNMAVASDGTASLTFSKVNRGASGIDEAVALQDDATPVAYYSLEGTRLDGPRPGICIVRYANGEARKVCLH